MVYNQFWLCNLKMTCFSGIFFIYKIEDNIYFARSLCEISSITCAKQVPAITACILCINKTSGFTLVFFPYVFLMIHLCICLFVLYCWRIGSFESCLKYFWEKLDCASYLLLISTKPTLCPTLCYWSWTPQTAFILCQWFSVNLCEWQA